MQARHALALATVLMVVPVIATAQTIKVSPKPTDVDAAKPGLVTVGASV